MTTGNKVKLTVVGLALLVMIVIIFQNIQAVSTRILFFEREMPLALLLFLTLAVGYAVGATLGLKFILRPLAGSKPAATTGKAKGSEGKPS